MELRDYQKETLDIMNSKQPGNYLVNLGTGLGKTVIFTEEINTHPEWKFLIISHREELVNQPIKYINRPVGIEMAKHKSNGETVISTCVQTMVRRYEKFNPEYFDVIIWDECHHMAAKTYMEIFNYFKPKFNFGFTATPNRFDNARLDHIFSEIIIEKNLEYGIKNNYLSNIYCKRFYINYDLKKVKSSNGDYQINQLENILDTDENIEAIAKIYKENRIGSTLIFAVSVKHCEDLQKVIPGSVVVTGQTKNRHEIIDKFTAGEIPCIISCMVFTEGTDIPRVETIIMARPTKNQSLYSQMLGRGTRLYPGKERLLLIDCVGVSGMNLCTAATLVGCNMLEEAKKPNTRDEDIEGDLFDLPEKVGKYYDKPDYWKINYKLVDLFEKGTGYTLHGINFYKHSNGVMTLNFKGFKVAINPPDSLGMTLRKGKKVRFQTLIDQIYLYLEEKHSEQRYMWDLNSVKNWGRYPASEKQIKLINNFLPTYDTSELTKLEANQILSRLLWRNK
jgi:hypothetical protein